MEPIDLAGMIWAALLGLPGQLVEAVQANPGPWALVGLGVVVVLGLRVLELRLGRRRRRRR